MSKRFSMCLGTILCAGLGLFGVPGQAQTVSAAPAPLAESIPASQGNSALDAIKKAFSARFPEVDVAAVRETPFPGLYEVQIGMDVVYTDAEVSYLLQGSLIDAKSRVDLTSERLAALSKVSFASLPLDLAIKQVKGTGAHKMAVFEDPNCVYCKQLHHTLKDIDNVTVYTFLLPILTPDSAIKARDVWCAKDQAGAWTDWMVNGKVPAQAQCDTPTKQILALGKKLMIQGTPAIFFADGTRVNGALPLDALREKLDSLN
ncbi:DsbC family protein [Paralcaligenes ureilyticus]|uniref:Thiol:disulfide interchange protein n=1 Tax=Paralcaligenes ureilyticus TaxID=627131 RepID=A0A4R3M3Y0_9BURK|nr:DsbC family protein [Paralcaligenes ureilyticus]TCT07293.1 thiol:disulfide interchange protein DsbC [Paralcaligenes ureilyticus]